MCDEVSSSVLGSWNLKPQRLDPLFTYLVYAILPGVGVGAFHEPVRTELFERLANVG